MANGQRFFGSVIFPGGFTATLLEIYHENKCTAQNKCQGRKHTGPSYSMVLVAIGPFKPVETHAPSWGQCARWMRLLVSAPAGTQDFRRLGWPVEGTGSDWVGDLRWLRTHVALPRRLPPLPNWHTWE